MCSWILAELVRFCASNGLSPDEARKIVESVIERRYPIFEEIEGRIYVEKVMARPKKEIISFDDKKEGKLEAIVKKKELITA